MEKRNKTGRIHLRLSDEQKILIDEKMKLTRFNNRNDFILKCVLEKPIINLDLKEIREHSIEMGRVGNNINQIIKKVNSTDILFLEELQEVKSLMRDLVKSEKELLRIFRSLI